MTEREVLLEKLVTEGHVNVEERQKLGVVHRTEVFRLLHTLLLSGHQFPSHAQVADQSSRGPIYEGGILHRPESGQVRLTWQRGHTHNPRMLGETHHEDFFDVDLAVERYIGVAWPNGIDGIKLA
jgi:hypothetical protein